MAIASSKRRTASASSSTELATGGGLLLGARRLERDEDRVADDVQPLPLAEHVLGSAQADALRAVAARHGRLLGLVGVGPDLQAAGAVGPLEHLLELGLVLEACRGGGQRADEHLAGRAVERDPLPFAEAEAVDARRLGAVVDDQRRATGDARLADLARHDRRVRGGAAACREHALRGGHAVEVVGRGLDPDEDHLLALAGHLERAIGVEHGLAHRRAGRGVEAGRDALRAVTWRTGRTGRAAAGRRAPARSGRAPRAR